MVTEDDSPPVGSGILRHTARQRGWEPAAGGDEHTHEAIERHVERYFGPIASVWHELLSDRVHVDVLAVQPTADRPYHTLVTSGMSDLPMAVPADQDASPYAELMISLPADWPLTSESFRDERFYWPIGLLKQVARLPHEYETWIGPWHSVPNGDPPEPYAPGVPFAGVVVAPMIKVEPAARTIVTPGGSEIALLALIPLHPAEVNLKVSRGTTALIDVLDRDSVTELFDPARPSGL
jgi:hypothetical protein